MVKETDPTNAASRGSAVAWAATSLILALLWIGGVGSVGAIAAGVRSWRKTSSMPASGIIRFVVGLGIALGVLGLLIPTAFFLWQR